MATGWSNYQVTQGYMEWFYDVKFVVVAVIALCFGWYSISRVISALKSDPSFIVLEPDHSDQPIDRNRADRVCVVPCLLPECFCRCCGPVAWLYTGALVGSRRSFRVDGSDVARCFAGFICDA